MEAVMLDGGRPSRRASIAAVHDPPLMPAERWPVALKVDPTRFTVLPTGNPGRQEIASVQSPPLIERLRQMMNDPTM